LRRQLSGESGGSELATTAFDPRILELQAKLQEMLTRFTEVHPDVIALQEQIATLNAQKKAMQDRSAGSLRNSGTNLVTQNLQIAYNQTEVEAASLRTQLEDRITRIAELRRMVNVLPEVEAEYSRLNRDYGITKAQYEQLVQRLETAKISDDAGRSTESRIRVVEPPVRALSTVSPNRPLMLTMVFFLGLIGAAALAWLLSQIRPVVSSLAVIQKITDAPVLGTIGTVASAQQLESARRSRLTAIAGVAALTVGFLLTLGFTRLGEQVGRLVSNAVGLT
jgi:polysaccharide chain length determinant protein (PEP-CTERM system associated)